MEQELKMMTDNARDRIEADRILEAYFAGLTRGHWEYSWMKDGVYYIGSCGTLLRQAQETVEGERIKAIVKISERFDNGSGVSKAR